jgi:hypothetical protein
MDAVRFDEDGDSSGSCQDALAGMMLPASAALR